MADQIYICIDSTAGHFKAWLPVIVQSTYQTYWGAIGTPTVDMQRSVPKSGANIYNLLDRHTTEKLQKGYVPIPREVYDSFFPFPQRDMTNVHEGEHRRQLFTLFMEKMEFAPNGAGNPRDAYALDLLQEYRMANSGLTLYPPGKAPEAPVAAQRPPTKIEVTVGVAELKPMLDHAASNGSKTLSLWLACDKGRIMVTDGDPKDGPLPKAVPVGLAHNIPAQSFSPFIEEVLIEDLQAAIAQIPWGAESNNPALLIDLTEEDVTIRGRWSSPVVAVNEPEESGVGI